MDWLIQHGEKYLRPESRKFNLMFCYKKSQVHYEPRGVVTAIVSWNYRMLFQYLFLGFPNTDNVYKHCLTLGRRSWLQYSLGTVLFLNVRSTSSGLLPGSLVSYKNVFVLAVMTRSWFRYWLALSSIVPFLHLYYFS